MEKVQSVQEIKENVASVLKGTDVLRCRMFGSYAKGQATLESDIDLMVDFYPGKEPDLFAFIALRNKLSKRLGKRVDMTTSDALSPFIRGDVLNSAQTLYERE